MDADSLNKIRNADFAAGGSSPRGWKWTVMRGSARWALADSASAGETSLAITSGGTDTTAGWVQRVRCKKKHWYRIDASVTALCEGDDRYAGAAVWVRPVVNGRASGGWIRLANVLRSAGPVVLRTLYETPSEAEALDVWVGVHVARGTVEVGWVYLVSNLEPDLECHPMALPPPVYVEPPPVRVRRVMLCDRAGQDRPLTAILRAGFDRASVRHTRTSQIDPGKVNADAVIFADDGLPSRIRSLSALARLAERRIVVLPIGAFAKLVGPDLKVRTIEQADDLLCARVTWGNFITRGFALHDVFPFAASMSDPRVLRQRQMRKGAAIQRLVRDHGYSVVLDSMTDQDATSHQPVCLYKPTAGGAIIVFDAAPLECLPTHRDEPNLAAHLLYNMLGREPAALGQYAVLPESEDDWTLLLSQMAERYPWIRARRSEERSCAFEVGGEESSWGLPVRPRPWIVIRSGLRGDDAEGVYGVWSYLKQLVRPEPYANPYVRDLLAAYRLAWIPMNAPWQGVHWDDAAAKRAVAMDGLDYQPIAAVIDVTTSATRTLRVVCDCEDSPVFGSADVLRALRTSFGAGRYLLRAVDGGAHLGVRDGASWRLDVEPLEVAIESSVFGEAIHRRAIKGGAKLVRIETPGSNMEFMCNSIWRTDMVATTLEHVLGAFYGVLAVNRRAAPVVYNAQPPLQPGEVLAIRRGSPQPITSHRAG